jgi:hypothetical protein
MDRQPNTTYGAGYTYRPQAASTKSRSWIGALVSFVIVFGGIAYGAWWLTGKPMVRLPGKIGEQILLTDAANKNNTDEITRADQPYFQGANIQTGIYGASETQRTLIITTFEGTSATSVTGFEQTLGGQARGGQTTRMDGTTLHCYAKGLTWITRSCFWEKDGIFGIAMVHASGPVDAEAQIRTDIDAVVTSWREKRIGR